MIRLENIRFDYGGPAMRFDLDVARGETLGLIGPSGAGKSTLLNLIAGFEYPSAGRILLDGADHTNTPPGARPVTMIFQDHNSFAHLDVRTNVALGLSPALKLTPAQWKNVDDALARTGLGALARRKPGAVSGGERQRIAIARALVRDKPILLLDEPFTALGPGLRGQMLDLIEELKAERGLTVLLVSHDPADARRIAGAIAFIDAGAVAAKMPAEAFFAARGIPGLDEYLGRRHG